MSLKRTPDNTCETRPGPTPNGGAYSVASYLDANGNPAPRNAATRVEIVEYDENDTAISTTYGNLPEN